MKDKIHKSQTKKKKKNVVDVKQDKYIVKHLKTKDRDKSRCLHSYSHSHTQTHATFKEKSNNTDGRLLIRIKERYNDNGMTSLKC